MSLLVFFYGASRSVPVDVGELTLLPCEPFAGATALIDVEPMLLTGNSGHQRQVFAQPVPQPMLLTGAAVYDNSEMSYWRACVNLHVALRSLQRQLDRNTTAFQNDPSDLNAARLSYNEEDIVEVERAIELCREWQSYFISAYPSVGRMTLSGCEVTKEKNAEITNVSMLLNPTAPTAERMGKIDTGGGTVVDEGDSFLVTYPPGDYTLSVEGDAPCTLVAVGGGGAGAPRVGDSPGYLNAGYDIVTIAGAGGGAGGVWEMTHLFTGTTPIHVGAGGAAATGTWYGGVEGNDGSPAMTGDRTTIGPGPDVFIVRCDGGAAGSIGGGTAQAYKSGVGGGSGVVYASNAVAQPANLGGDGVLGNNNCLWGTIYDLPNRSGGSGAGAGGNGSQGRTQIEPNPSNSRVWGGPGKTTDFGTFGAGGHAGGLAGHLGTWPFPPAGNPGDGGYGGEMANNQRHINGYPGNGGVVMIRFSKDDVESVV